LTLDFAAFRVGGVGGDSDLLEQGAITGLQVAGDVDHEYGVIGGNRVQVLAVRVAHFIEAGVIVTPADHPLARFGLLFLDVLPQQALDVCDGATSPMGLGSRLTVANLADKAFLSGYLPDVTSQILTPKFNHDG
jgi:hypothetical protein